MADGRPMAGGRGPMQATLGGMGVAPACAARFCTACTTSVPRPGCTDSVERLHGNPSPLRVGSHTRASAVLPLPLQLEPAASAPFHQLIEVPLGAVGEVVCPR